jgi:hypothetical protein
VKTVFTAISASSFRAFESIGDRDSLQLLYNSRKDVLYSLVEAELPEAKGRFLVKNIDDVWSMCPVKDPAGFS